MKLSNIDMKTLQVRLESNPVQLGEKNKRYHCAMPPPWKLGKLWIRVLRPDPTQNSARTNSKSGTFRQWRLFWMFVLDPELQLRLMLCVNQLNELYIFTFEPHSRRTRNEEKFLRSFDLSERFEIQPHRNWTRNLQRNKTAIASNLFKLLSEERERERGREGK